MRRSDSVLFIILVGGLIGGLKAQTAVTLSPAASPSIGEPGVTVITVTGSGFPSGTIPSANVTVTLTPAAGGAAVSTNASAVTTIVGATRRVSFTIPSAVSVSVPTAYSLSVGGTTSTGTAFASSNTASVTINPSAALANITPAAGQPGQTLSVTLTGQWTNFVQGSTQASFGAGISVGGAAAGAFGPVTVVNATTATATLGIAIGSTAGARAVTVQTGAEQAVLNSGFTVQPGIPSIISVTPASGQQGQALTGVAITGVLTHFTQGTPVITFSNSAVTASAIQVSDDTHVTATLTITSNAATGPSNITVVTGAETAIGTGLFTVGSSPPAINQVNPNIGQQGQQNLVVTITAQFTHFAATTTANFGSGITVGSFTVNSPMTATAVLAIDPAATTGPRTVSLTTNSEVATLANGFTVTAGTPAITSMTPSSGQQGQILSNVTILGAFTHFTQGTPVVSFSTPGITAGSVQTIDNTHLRLTLTIASTASTGVSNVTVVTGPETANGIGMFTVVASPPLITQLNPNAGQQGQQNLSVLITGQSTHFAQGTTLASFAAGITVSALTVNSATSAMALLNIDPIAAAGTRNITLTTNTEVATLANGFTVVAGTPTISQVNPAAGKQGQTLTGVVITGTFTHFTQGTPIVTFTNTGITASNVTVTDNSHLTLTLTIAANAANGPSNVTVLTGSESTTGAALFMVGNGTPLISQINPASGSQGQVLAGVVITGAFTHFTQAMPTVTFSKTGVTASSVQATDDTHLTLTLTIAGNAAPGVFDVIVLTGSETAAALSLFTVLSSTPIISQVNPASGQPGQTLSNVAITGQLTHFTQATPTVTFSNASITATSVAVIDNTHLTITLAIAPTATIGASNVTVITGTETAAGAGLFTVSPVSPILSLKPNTGQQGQQGLSVTITGQSTRFVQGITTASFGSGITVTSLTVASLTSATALLNIDSEAATTTRNISLTTNSEVDTLVNGFSVTAGAPTITITSPTNLSFLNISPTTVNGTVSGPTAGVTVNSIQAPVSNGIFSIQLPLAEGPNLIAATATSTAALVSTATIQVTLDTTPPHVTITSPTDQFVTTASSASVAGNVNDIVVGTVNAQQAQVTVNGISAQVANRTFLATNVPLNLGSNVIQAVARDQAGNAATTQITVIRQAPAAQPQIQLISGNNQSGVIGSGLAAPLVVALTDAGGNPVPNAPVIFKVTQDNGMVSNGGAQASSVVATTNAQGQAQAQWTLGMRAGAGSDGAEAYAVGFSGTAIFTATSTLGPAGLIVIDSGNNQIGAISKALPKPLVAVVVDSGNNRLPNVPVTFTVVQGDGKFAGQTSTILNTDSDGRVVATLTLGSQEGNSNNLIQATFSGDQGFPASFMASGRAEGPVPNTTISGVVLDNSNIPVPGVTIRAVLSNLLTSNSNVINAAATVQSNTQGQFTIPQAPVGFVKLLVDGSTAQRTGTFPTLDYDMVTVAGQNNVLGMPIYLLPLSTNNQLCVTGTTGGGTLTIPQAPGFSLTFGPGQVTFPGGSQTGCVSVTVVHPDKVPMSPGFGQQPRFIVTIQPSGALFNPPAPITLPNVDGLAPRAVTEMYSFDHDIGAFVAIGTGNVSDDGQVIRSGQGVGVLKAGWHCGGNPNTRGTVADCPVCNYCQGPTGNSLSCIPDPSQANLPCPVSGNPCVTGTCGYDPNFQRPTGQCTGGSPNPLCRQVCNSSNVGAPCTIGNLLGMCDAIGYCQVCGSLPVGTSCVTGGTALGMCNSNGQCQGSGPQCNCPGPANVCVDTGCVNGVCTAPTPVLNSLMKPCGNGGTCVDGTCTGCSTTNATITITFNNSGASFLSIDDLSFSAQVTPSCAVNQVMWMDVTNNQPMSQQNGTLSPSSGSGALYPAQPNPPMAIMGRTSPLSYQVEATVGSSVADFTITQDGIDTIRQQYIDMQKLRKPPSDIGRALFINIAPPVPPGHFTFAAIKSREIGADWALFSIFQQLEDWWSTANRNISTLPVIGPNNRGYSTPTHNLLIGGATESQHIYGTAADVQATSSTWYDLLSTVPSGACLEPPEQSCPMINDPTKPCHFHADWRSGAQCGDPFIPIE